jgi:hypothetical protein
VPVPYFLLFFLFQKNYTGNILRIGRNENQALYFWDFYFRALGSLVVLSFAQLLSFSSVLPKPLSETLTRRSDGRNPVQLTVLCWWVGPHRVGLVKRDRVGQDETVFGHTSGARAIACGAVVCGSVWVQDVGMSGSKSRLAVFNAPFSSLSLDLIHSWLPK